MDGAAAAIPIDEGLSRGGEGIAGGGGGGGEGLVADGISSGRVWQLLRPCRSEALQHRASNDKHPPAPQDQHSSRQKR